MNRQNRLGFNPLFKAATPDSPEPAPAGESGLGPSDKAVNGILGPSQVLAGPDEALRPEPAASQEQIAAQETGQTQEPPALQESAAPEQTPGALDDAAETEAAAPREDAPAKETPPIAPCGPESRCKKDKISIEREMTLPKAVQYLEDLVNNLRAGTLCLYSGEECLVLRPEPLVELEIKASGKKKKGKLCLKMTWRSAKDKKKDKD